MARGGRLSALRWPGGGGVGRVGGRVYGDVCVHVADSLCCATGAGAVL